MLQWIANLVTGKLLESALDAYKAKLAAGNSSERIAADMAAKELDLIARERALATQVIIAEEGRWWSALPRWVMAASVAGYFGKIMIWDKVLQWGTTDPLTGDAQTLAMAVIAFYFGGRTLEKLARIVKRG